MTTRLRHTENGSFAPAEHLEFVRNTGRNRAFKAAFERLAQGKTVLDIGTGSGIMAIYAALAGAKRVIAVEKDEKMAKIAQQNFKRNGLKNGIHLIVGDAFGLTRDDIGSIDILVGELLSTWCIVEPQVPVFRHILSSAEKPLVTIPQRIINRVEGVNAQFGDKDGLVRIPTIYFEFDSTRPKAVKLTSAAMASEILFSKDMEPDARVTLSLRVLRPGMLNALRLTSITETCDGVRFGPTNDTMPKMIVPLSEEIFLREGETFRFTLSYTYGGGWGKFSVLL